MDRWLKYMAKSTVEIVKIESEVMVKNKCK